MGRTGRRPGNPDTREAILNAARKAFAERGYDAASIRLIATGAGVDPALVHHYFGTKEQLFIAAMQVPINPAQLLPGILAGRRDELGERIVRTILSVWDSPAGAAAAAFIRSAVTNESMATLLREFIFRRVVRTVVKELRLEPAEGALRASLVASQVAGLIVTRYLIRIEPIARAPTPTIIAAIGPTLQHYLTGDLGAAVRPPA